MEEDDQSESVGVFVCLELLPCEGQTSLDVHERMLRRGGLVRKERLFPYPVLNPPFEIGKDYCSCNDIEGGVVDEHESGCASPDESVVLLRSEPVVATRKDTARCNGREHDDIGVH